MNGIIDKPGNKDSELPPIELLKQMGITDDQLPVLEEYLANGMQLIHGAQTRDSIIDGLRGTTLGQVFRGVIDKLEDSSEGMDIPDLVKFVSGFALLNQIAQVGAAAGVKEYSEQDIMQAFSEVLASQLEKGIKSGKYNPQELKQSAELAAQKLKTKVA